jgi:hypothetical protein
MSKDKKEKNMRDKGHLVSVNTYPIQPNNSGMRVAINAMTMLQPGDRVYEFLRDDGVVLLIPERIKDKVIGE